MGRNRRKTVSSFIAFALVFSFLIEPAAVFAASADQTTAAKSQTILQDENFGVRETLAEETSGEYAAAQQLSDPSAVQMFETVMNYELAKANADGTFTKIADYATFSEAETAMTSSTDASAVVLDLTRTVGNGVIDMKDGIVVIAGEKVNLSTVTLGYTYASNGNDAYFYSSTGTTVKLRISGADADAVPIDRLELIPRAQATVQSYYAVNASGDLIHYSASFTRNTTTNRYTGTTSATNMWKAPSTMSAGTKYYSSDGCSFYTTPQLNSAAITYYYYYKYLPFRSKTSYTADQINAYIASWNKPASVLNGKGQAFIDAQNNYGVNAGLLLALAIHESAYGTSNYATTRYNLFGINAIDSDPSQADYFASVEDCINYEANRMISQGYSDAKTDFRYFGINVGSKKAGMNVCYASDPYWGEKIAAHAMKMDIYLGGKDSNKYQLAFSNSITDAKLQASASAATVYTLANKGKSYPNNIPVIVVQSSNGWYKIQSDMAMDSSGVASYSYQYNYALSKVYVNSSNFTLLNNPVVKYVDPANEVTKSYSISRLSGADRYATAAAISQASYTQASTVILATAWNFPDALAAGPLAIQENAPILLTDTNSLPQSTLDEIKRLKAAKVVIMGGESVIGSGVAAALQNLGITVERVSGSNRFATAVEAARKVRAKSGVTDKAVLVYGWNFPDALSIGSYASKEGIPILLTGTDELNADTKAALTEFGIKQVQIVGSSEVISQTVENQLVEMGITVTRDYGNDRFSTSVQIAGKYFAGSKDAVVANGWNFPDALAAVPMAAKMNAPVVLVEQNSVPADVSTYISQSPLINFTIVGGEPAVGTEVKNGILSLQI